MIPSWKFKTPAPPTSIMATNSREHSILTVYPFPWTPAAAKPAVTIPVPTLNSPRKIYVSLPYIAFGPTGSLQVLDNNGQLQEAPFDEYIPIVRGSVFLARDSTDDNTLVWDAPNISEPSLAVYQSDYHVVVIDRLTGRARVAKPEINSTTL